MLNAPQRSERRAALLEAVTDAEEKYAAGATSLEALVLLTVELHDWQYVTAETRMEE